LTWGNEISGQIPLHVKAALETAAALEWTDPDSAISSIRNTLELIPSGLHSLERAHMAMALSKAYNSKRDRDSIAHWNMIAEKIYLELDDQRGQAEVSYQKGFTAFCEMDYEQALDHILQGLEIMENLDDEAGIALGHLRMARIFHFTAKLAQSAAYGRLAGTQFEKLRNYPDAWDSWSFAGHGYRMLNDSVQALECFANGMRMAELSGYPKVVGLAYNDLAAFYLENNLYDSASAYFQKSLELADPTNERDIMVIKNGLGQVYLHTGQFQKCIDILSEALQVVKQTGDIFFMSEVPEYIAKSYAGLGQYDSAFKYMELNWLYTDSVFTLGQDQALEDMKSKYESDKKDQLIARQIVERKYGLALVTATCLLAFMFYRRYIQKKKINEILDQRNKEKDFLLKEIHHRVKNNLQILSSLLNLQADYIKDENALNAITEGRNRVQSMAFIHQQLYSDKSISSVNMKEYLADLCGHLSDSFTSDQKAISINSDVQVELIDVETAIPLGLIVNELITNSIKYAFNQQDRGVITVHLWLNESDQLCLLVKDDGEGMAIPNALDETISFGTDLIKLLSQKLKGTIEVDSEKGYSTKITFDRFKATRA